MNSCTSLLLFSVPITPHLQRIAYFTTIPTRRLDAVNHLRACIILLCHCICQSYYCGTGISTCCPSPTTFVLGLGPDLPWEDEPSPGNLGPSTAMFLTWLSLLIPAFSLLHSPTVLTVCLLPVQNAPLPITGIYNMFFSRFLVSHALA